MAKKNIAPPIFEIMTEIGIINQLAGAVFSKKLPKGLHMSQFATISHLIRRGDAKTPLEIANAMQVTKATMSHTLNVLERHGLITIGANPDDRRSKLVFITREGGEFFQQSIASLAPAIGQLSKALTPEQVETLLPLLRQVREFMDDNREI